MCDDGINSRLAECREPDTFARTLINNLGETRFFDPIKERPSMTFGSSVTADDLVAGIDRVGYSLAKCMKMAEAALLYADYSELPILHQPCALHRPRGSTDDIFFGVNRVNQGIADCIKLAEATLSNHGESETSTMEFNRNFDDFFDNLDEIPSCDLVRGTK